MNDSGSGFSMRFLALILLVVLIFSSCADTSQPPVHRVFLRLDEALVGQWRTRKTHKALFFTGSEIFRQREGDSLFSSEGTYRVLSADTASSTLLLELTVGRGKNNVQIIFTNARTCLFWFNERYFYINGTTEPKGTLSNAE